MNMQKEIKEDFEIDNDQRLVVKETKAGKVKVELTDREFQELSRLDPKLPLDNQKIQTMKKNLLDTILTED